MQRLFHHCPEAIGNTLRIADSCDFNLDADLGYRLPDADVPDGFTPQSFLERLCYEAALRRYGEISDKVQARLDEEFRLIELHGMAGFLLLYREIALIAREIMVERGLVSPEAPLESSPPGGGRGSSVALLVGYLIGISHIDPLAWNLSLERFISEDAGTLPDIDLDFPRGIRDALIERVHGRFGPEHAVLAGAISAGSPECVACGIEGNPYRENLFRVANNGRVTYQGSDEDYESFPEGQARYLLTVTATDSGGATASVSVTVNIGDVAE